MKSYIGLVYGMYTAIQDIANMGGKTAKWIETDPYCRQRCNALHVLFNTMFLALIQGHRSWCQSKAHMRLPISYQ